MSREERVGIARLKARLSHYLRRVRNGARVTVLDRDQPVAMLVPLDAGPDLIVRSADAAAGRIGDLEPPPRFAGEVDIVALLREERADRI